MNYSIEGQSQLNGQEQTFEICFENVPLGLDIKPLKIPQLKLDGYRGPMEITCTETYTAVENPDVKMLELMKEWRNLAKAHNETPRFTVTSWPKGAYVTFAAAPMVQVQFDGRRTARVFAKKHDLVFNHAGVSQ